MSGWIRRHRLVAFFVLSYAVAWAGWPFWAAGLLPEPLFLACGPLVAALVVVGVAEGRPGYGALLERMTRWRVGALWWVVALTLPPVMVLATALLNTAAGAPAVAFGGLAWGELALLFGLYLVNPLGGALGEEPGWRGYALPRLQADRTPLAAALVLGVVVAGWHLPLVVFGMLGALVCCRPRPSLSSMCGCSTGAGAARCSSWSRTRCRTRSPSARSATPPPTPLGRSTCTAWSSWWWRPRWSSSTAPPGAGSSDEPPSAEVRAHGAG